MSDQELSVTPRASETLKYRHLLPHTSVPCSFVATFPVLARLPLFATIILSDLLSLPASLYLLDI